MRVRDLGTRSHHTTHGIDDGENVRGALDSCRTGPRCASLSADDPAARAASGASRQTGARDRVETLTARRGPALASFEACRAGRCPSDGACGPPADQGVRPVCSADARKRCQSIGSDASAACPSAKRRTALASPGPVVRQNRHPRTSWRSAAPPLYLWPNDLMGRARVGYSPWHLGGLARGDVGTSPSVKPI